MQSLNPRRNNLLQYYRQGRTDWGTALGEKAGGKPVVNSVTKFQVSHRSHLERCVHLVLEGRDKFQWGFQRPPSLRLMWMHGSWMIKSSSPRFTYHVTTLQHHLGFQRLQNNLFSLNQFVSCQTKIAVLQPPGE